MNTTVRTPSTPAAAERRDAFLEQLVEDTERFFRLVGIYLGDQLGLYAALAAHGERRYQLPPGHDEVLTDAESLNYLAPLAQIALGAIRPLDALVDAFRSGAGIPYAEQAGVESVEVLPVDNFFFRFYRLQ